MVPKNCLDRGLLLPTNCSHRLRHAAMHYRLQGSWMGQASRALPLSTISPRLADRFIDPIMILSVADLANS